MEVFESLDQKKLAQKSTSESPWVFILHALHFFTHGTHWRYDLMEGDKLSNKAAPRIDVPWDDFANISLIDCWKYRSHFKGVFYTEGKKSVGLFFKRNLVDTTLRNEYKQSRLMWNIGTLDMPGHLRQRGYSKTPKPGVPSCIELQHPWRWRKPFISWRWVNQRGQPEGK